MHDHPTDYPILLEITYPDRELNRLTTFFRLIMAIPIGIVLALLSGPAVHAGSGEHVFAAGGILWLPTMLTLVFRQQYPRWWFDWNPWSSRGSAPGSPPTWPCCATSIPRRTKSKPSTSTFRTPM